MKIIFLNKYQYKVNRGAETFVEELGSRLQKNHQVEIFTNLNFLSLLRKKIDIIIPTNGRLQVFIVRLISWLKGAKMVVSGQSGAGLDDRLNLYAFPDTFIALSNYQSEWAKRINPFVKVETIPNGVDLSTFKGETFKGRNTILSVGAFTYEKRHDLTIKAVSLLKNIRLIIVGSGGDKRAEMEKLGKNLLGERLQILSLPHDKMPEMYRRASMLAFPCVPWESFGIVLVEAMASGLPVVATNDPIRKEIVGDAGILVDPTNIDQYAKALEKAITTEWGNLPRQQSEKFSWDNIAKQYEDLIVSLTQKP